MVEFGTGYMHPMDRDYGKSSTSDNSTNDTGIGIKDIGMSVPLGIAAPNVQGVAAKIRTGARKFELAFPGTGRSQRGAQTPGIYGKLQRQALEELSRANQVDFTTHASYGIYGVAGMDQQGNFSKASKKFAVDEIKRAIEFASDVARGGNVVVHTGEFQRPLSEAEWNQKGDYKDKFRMYGEEPEQATFKVVDDRTGAALVEARKNRPVARPVWNKYEEANEYFKEHKGGSYKDDKGNLIEKGDYIDYLGNKIDAKDRLPRFNKQTREFDTQLMTWDIMEKEAEEMTERARAFWRKNQGKSKEFWEKDIWAKFKDAKSEKDIIVRAEEAYVISSMETSAAQARGFAHYYAGSFDEHVENLKKLTKAKEFFEKLEKTTDPEEQWKLKRTMPPSIPPDLIPPETKLTSEVVEHYIRGEKQRMSYAQEGAASQWAQAREQLENMKHVESAETYALKESYDSYAESGMKAMMESDKLEKKGKLKEPLFVAMENIFPESYGSHPDEMIDLVDGGRKRMAEMLKQKGYSESDAKREAEDHIKGHLDTGHLNLWRKYWQGDAKKSPEQNDKDFNKWLLKKTEDMAKRKIIGSVHLVDNYGYQDDHLSPGEGNCPVKDMTMILKKHGFKGSLIVEPGADASTDLSDFHGLMKTWKLFGSPVYGAGMGGASGRDRRWGDVQYSHFGQTQPAYFVFGGYSPSEDWTLWSGVPME